MRTAKTLIRLDGCPGWSESSLGAHAILLVCHEAAHIVSQPHNEETKTAKSFMNKENITCKTTRNNPTGLCKQCAPRSDCSFQCRPLRSSLIRIYLHCLSFRPLYFGRIMSRDMTKPTKWLVRPVKTQISLGIRPVWFESSLSAWRNLGSSATQWAHSEYSDQTGRMSRLIWVFAGRTVILLVLSWRCSNRVVQY